MSVESRMSVASRALGLVDLTDLGDDSDDRAIERLCTRAQTSHGPVAAVCIWPRFVSLARKNLQGTGITIATVVNFPEGGPDIDSTVAETLQAIADGADEIDLVMPYRAFASGEIAVANAMVVAVRTATAGQAVLKVILETGELKEPDMIRKASAMAIAAGADFIKTSTGKVAINATLEVAKIMLQAIADSEKLVGFKPAGGIKTTEDCAAYLDLADTILGRSWVNRETFRFGASSVLDDLLAALDGKTTDISKGY
jgi:deoxyribose-phosphate aldolase